MGLSKQPGSEQAWDSELHGSRSSELHGIDPYQGHLRKQHWASDLGQRWPDVANSIGASTGQKLLREWPRARDLCRFRHESGTYENVGKKERSLWIWA